MAANCAQHPWTRGFIAVFESPYFAVTGASGSFRLDSVPPGTYRLDVTYAPYWHTPAGCLSPSADGMTELTVRHPGIVSLRFAVTARRALAAVVGDNSDCR